MDNPRPLRFFTFGGSYPGALASWYRAAYPDKTLGSLASSGVVHAILSFPEFDSHVSLASFCIVQCLWEDSKQSIVPLPC